MKKIILILMLLFPILIFSQTKNIVPRADSEGQLGTSVKAWAKIYIDSLFLNGVSLHTTLSGKAPIANPTFTGNVTMNEGFSLDPGTGGIPILVTAVEFNYLSGITSAVQTQLNGKQATMGSNDNYVSDAQLIVIGNTVGVNTGDNAVNSLYSGLAASKQNTLVSGSNIRTVNGNTLLGSTDLVISASTDTNVTKDIIQQYLADSAYASIYTGAEGDSLWTLAGNAIQSSALNSLAELDTQIGITGTASATTYWRGDNSWASIPVDTLVQPFAVIDTVITGSLAGWKVPYDITILEVAAYTDANTTTFNLEERGEATPNTSGTNVMTSSLVADNDQQETTTFTNAGIAKDSWLVPVISATGDVEIFSVTVRYVKVY